MPVEEAASTTSQRLTVLQVLPALESGGTERGVLEIAEALVQAGHRSLVISAGGRMVSELTLRGSEHFRRRIGTKSPMAFRHVPWLRRFLIDQNVDLIDIHSRMPGWVTLAAWKTLSVADRPSLITTVHGLHSVNVYSSIMCRGEHVVAVSSAVRDYVIRNYPFVSPDKLHLIHRGIDRGQFPRGYRPDESWKSSFFKAFPHAAGRRLLTLPGRLTRLKGHEDFLEVISQLRSLGHDVHGLIAGDADPRRAAYAEEIRSKAQATGLRDHVTFTGHRTDIREIFAISECVMSLSSTPESFGRTVAEALSIGTPVAGYRHGGVAEVLSAQFPSGGVNPGDISAIVKVVHDILRQTSPTIPAENPFDRSRMMSMTLELYQRAIASSCRSRGRTTE